MTDPTLAEIVRAYVDERVVGLHVSCPATIVSYDATTQRCSVRPASHVRIAGQEIALPVIDDVPVSWPRATGCLLSFPLAAGDPVLLVFSDRMLDQWRGTGVVSPPTSPRMHHLTDAIALPLGVWPDSQPDSRVSATDVVLAGPGSSKVSIKPDGSVVIESGGSVHVGGTGTALALASLVNAQLQALAAVFAAWVPSPGDGGTVLKTALTGLAASGWPASTGATKAKGV